MNRVEIEDFWLDQKRWTLLGDRASVAKDTEKVFLTDVRILVYTTEPTEAPEVDIEVTSEEGELDWENGIVTLSSDVVMTRNTEVRLTTDKAVYEYNKGLLNIPDDVNIHYQRDTVLGRQLTYNVAQKTIHLLNAVLLE